MQHRQSCRDGAYAAQAKRPRRSNQVAQAGNRKHDHHTESRAMSRRTREKDASLQKLPKHHVKYFFITLVFAAGLLMFLYPVISNLWNQYRNSLLASHYTQTVQKIDTSKIEAEWKEAEEYNKNHTENYIKDAFTQSEQYILTHPYDELLNPDGNEVMGSLEIPKISVTLAIYHGMGEEALSKGCGHIEGTSLPIGGKSSHAVLAAHRGLAGARLFTDLDQLKKGDVFYLHVLDKTLAYEVDKITVCLPDDVSGLKLEKGKDLVTLLTCTPYGVNSHRLLVRGKRIPYEEAKEQEKATTNVATKIMDTRSWIRVGAGALFIILFIVYMKRLKKGDRAYDRKVLEKREKKEAEEREES